MTTEVRLPVTKEQARLIYRAATARGQTPSEFILAAALREAEDQFLDAADISLSPDGFRQLLDQLDCAEVGDSESVRRHLTASRPWSD